MEAYKTLLLDVIEGDRSLFIRFDEVEWAWRVVDPILREWSRNRGSIATYAAGTWGPNEASRLFERDDQSGLVASHHLAGWSCGLMQVRRPELD